jgi:hypothetical protein
MDVDACLDRCGVRRLGSERRTARVSDDLFVRLGYDETVGTDVGEHTELGVHPILRNGLHVECDMRMLDVVVVDR